MPLVLTRSDGSASANALTSSSCTLASGGFSLTRIVHSMPCRNVTAMTLLLAAVLHDFWTLEERTLEQVFADQNPKRVPGSLRAHRTADGARRIVYLPQIVYAAQP